MKALARPTYPVVWAPLGPSTKFWPTTSGPNITITQYARSPGYLDWATQPDPFRTFAGAPRTDLPLLADRLVVPFADLYQPGAVASNHLGVNSVAVFFELSLGLSAWKQYRGSRWAVRCNPSSGNLHPTEGYAIVPCLPGLPAGCHHYVSRDHCLEHRGTFDPAGCRPARFSSVCRPSTGGKRGNTASVHFDTVSTTSDTPSPLCVTRPPPSAGPLCSSTI